VRSLDRDPGHCIRAISDMEVKDHPQQGNTASTLNQAARKIRTENRHMQKLNRQLFMAAFIGGLFLGSSNPFTVWIHEQGHLQVFRMNGIQAMQTAPNMVTAYTSTAKMDYFISGAMSEMVFFFFAFWLLFAIGNPRLSGLRSLWFPVGIPIGAMHSIWFRAYRYTDFHREYSSEILMCWTVIGLCILISTWVITYRWRISVK
jgi:hypothetical protein